MNVTLWETLSDVRKELSIQDDRTESDNRIEVMLLIGIAENNFATHRKMRKHETAVCGTARTVVWEVGKCENRRQMPFMISIYLLPDCVFLYILFES